MRCTGLGISALLALFLVVAAGGCTTPSKGGDLRPAHPLSVETLRVQLASGSAAVDVYWPDQSDQAPLVIVTHGFMRSRRNMSGWGNHLASKGFVVAVPDLPTRSNHVKNGRFVNELQAYLADQVRWQQRIDPARVGYMGFSAGGLSSLLAAASSTTVAIWVGLDPVDRDGLGARAAPNVKARTTVLTAEPSACNAQGNASGLIAALPQAEHHRVSGAVHVDAEWPTTSPAQAVCGASTEARRAEFRDRATRALQETLSVLP